MTSLLIRGGTLVTESGARDADLLVENGKIAQVGSGLSGDRVLDAHGMWVMPGGIDTHTHLHHPIDRIGIRTADDFHTGTVAAAHGGVTSFIDFSLQRAGDALAHARDVRLQEMEPECVIDYGFHTIITDVNDDTLAEIPDLIQAGFPSFKIYMTYADKIVQDDALIKVLEATGKHGGLVYLHCEHDCAVTHLIQQHLSQGDTGPLFHARSRPPEVEAEATNRAIMMAGVVGAPVCIAHVTSSGAARHVAEAREQNQAVASETCPQYLVLTEDVYHGEGFETAKFVCSPPMRTMEHQEALWSALENGSIQQVSSDHAPFKYEGQKTQGREDFTRIPNGLPGIETRLPLLFTYGVRTGRISPERFVQLVATNPARIFGMYPHKGTLDVGSDADVILVDPNATRTATASELHSAVDYTPFEGMELGGFPEYVLSRGDIIVDRGTLHATKGRGRRMDRSPIHSTDLP